MIISDQQTTCRDDPKTLLSLMTGYLPVLFFGQEPYPGQVKTPVVNTDDLNSVPGIHMVEGENLL